MKHEQRYWMVFYCPQQMHEVRRIRRAWQRDMILAAREACENPPEVDEVCKQLLEK